MAETIQPNPNPASTLPHVIQESSSSSSSSSPAPTKRNDWLQIEPKSDSSIANRVCTPLGLFIQSSQTAAPLRLSQTLTPESIQSPTSSTDRHNTSISTSPTQQSATSPTRSRILASNYMQKSNDSIGDKLRQVATITSAQSLGDGAPSPLFSHAEMAPLHTSTLQSNTKILHPKPISRTPVDVASRPGTAASSVAQLERTAQQLSLTSSIENAIRDLHSELKRSDSQRSSILAATIKAGDDMGSPVSSQIKRHLSTTSSIVSTNIAARQGGYSPAAFVRSPTASMTARLISGSLPPAALLEADAAGSLSRHGPGKGSLGSLRSAKLSLADISESDPVTLTHHVLDQADMAPPVGLEPSFHHAPRFHQALDATTTAQPDTHTTFTQITHDAPTQPPISGLGAKQDGSLPLNTSNRDYRPSTSYSQDTFHQVQNAFFDFDGVHCPENEADGSMDRDPIVDLMQDRHMFGLPPTHFPQDQLSSYTSGSMPCPLQPVGLVGPQPHIDDASGVQMKHYPVRVPATLNIPPKLSKRPNADQRNQRQSKVLSAMMMKPAHGSTHEDAAAPALDPTQEPNLVPMDERHHERRPSFLPMSKEDLDLINQPFAALPIQGQESTDNLAATLQIPKRKSEPKVVDKRKSRLSMNIPAQLRASAYFDSQTLTTNIEAKNGSASNALDDILDASANAPVHAFTDHLYAGKLGSEVYGVQKRKSMASFLSLKPPSAEHEGKKRSSLLWLGRRRHSYNSQESLKPQSVCKAPKSRGNDKSDDVISSSGGPVQQCAEEEHAGQDGKTSEEEAGEEKEDEDEEEVYDYVDGPTTLLAELQLRKHQQKERIQGRVRDANEMQATLLELDAIAETQRVDRKSKRVTLAWEYAAEHANQNGSDDDDVPLAIIAARQQGAKNMADLERPLGLIEKREIEENEPLSKRRARLQGLDKSFSAPRPHSMLMAPSRLGDMRPRQSMISLGKSAEEEVEHETLAERRRRMATETEQESKVSLPPTRPVSMAFSTELLSQFETVEAERSGGEGQQKETKAVGIAPEEEETLGQRRRRLQAEKIARQKEMAHGNSVSTTGLLHKDRHMSLASVLSAHPRQCPDVRVQEGLRRREEEERLVREREAKMAAMRMQMPSTLSVPSVVSQSQGFQGGFFNNGTGGHFGQATEHGHFNRARSMVFQNGGHFQQGVYLNPQLGGSVHGLTGLNMHNRGGNGGYGGMPSNMQRQMQRQMQMQKPVSHNGASMDRVEVWRQSVLP